MAVGDDAALAGMPLVSPTDDRRDGWEEINRTRDYIATQTSDASRITTGVLSSARIPSLPASKITTGVLSSARIPSLPASRITSGTIAFARLPTIPWGSIGAKPSVFPPSAHQHDRITNGTVTLRTGSTYLFSEAIFNRTYSTLNRAGVRLATVTENGILGSLNSADVGTWDDYFVRSWGPTDAAYARSVSGGGFYSVWMDSGKQFGRNTSSIRYKEDVLPFDTPVDDVLALTPVTYHRKNSDEPDSRELGLIAEDCVNVPGLVQWDVPRNEDGSLQENGVEQPETVRYETALPVLLLGVVKDQQRRLDELEDRIAALEGK